MYSILTNCSTISFLLFIVNLWLLSSGHAQGIDQETYLLQSNEKDFAIFDGNESLVVPREWLRPAKEEADEKYNIVPSFNYSEIVTAFPISSNFIGLHISSYDIQKEGSGSAALGRDVFLVLDTQNKLLSFGLNLGITKSRGRYVGCATALFHELEIADINEDGSMDIGVTKKEIKCIDEYDEEEELDRVVSSEKTHPKNWYIFSSNHWEYLESYGSAKSSDTFATKLPLIDLVIDPVSYVKGKEADSDPK